MKVEYVKPESTLNTRSYDTKFVYFWGWADNYVLLASSSSAGVLFSKSAEVGLMLLGSKLKPLQSIMLSLLQMSYSDFMSEIGDVKVKGSTFANYYYQNKFAYVNINGSWMPGCAIGLRKGFNYLSGGYQQPSGQWVLTEISGTVGLPDNNPTNYDKLDKKLNFDNNQWMINKAIEYLTSYDVPFHSNLYATVTNKL